MNKMDVFDSQVWALWDTHTQTFQLQNWNLTSWTSFLSQIKQNNNNKKKKYSQMLTQL